MTRDLPFTAATGENPSPLVSAVICSLNGHERLSRAVDSVLAQEYRALELIIVDDGSRPSLEEVVRRHPDPRIKFFRFDKNQGLHAVREFALRQARGEFVALLDDDDCWLPEKLSRQLPLINGVPEVGLVCSGALDVYPDGRRLLRLPPGEVISYDQELVDECTIASSVLFRRAAYEEVGGFDPALYRCGDWDCWVRLARKYLIKAVAFPLVITHMRGGSLQRSGDIAAFAADRWKVVAKNRREIEARGLWQQAVARHLHSVGVRYLRARDFRSARRTLREALQHQAHLDTTLAWLLALLRIEDNLGLRRFARFAKQSLRTLRGNV